MGGVHRYVCSARFEDSQQSHHHLERALDAETHQDIRPDAGGLEAPRQPVRPAVQLSIGQFSGLGDNCRGVRSLFDLYLEQPVQAYLDPGSGSMFLQLALGGLAALGVVVKLYWHRFLSIFRKRDPSS